MENLDNLEKVLIDQVDKLYSYLDEKYSTEHRFEQAYEDFFENLKKYDLVEGTIDTEHKIFLDKISDMKQDDQIDLYSDILKFLKERRDFIQHDNLLVPRNIKERKEKLKQMNIKLLSQEVIDGDLYLDESFMDIDPKFIKIKKVKGDLWLTGGLWTEIPEWLKDVEIDGDFSCSNNKLKTLKNCPQKIGRSFLCINNKLSSLKNCPSKISGVFYCYSNKTKLKLPSYVELKGKFINY